MLNASNGKRKQASLLQEYASLVGDAVLRHRARAAEHRARIESELSSRIKSDFIANMSHELRTPLNTVLGFSKILAEHDKRKLDDAEVVQYASLIHDAASHLLSVINDILDISKIKSGNYALEEFDIDIGELVRDSVDAITAEAKSSNVEIALTIAHNLPPVRGDEQKLLQVFGNLLSNAVKFTEAGGRVDIDVEEFADGALAIRIRDTGIGMTDIEIQVALEPFAQVDGGRTRLREGTGLGLPIAKALVELHNGSFRITSTKGKGTEILILLPPADRLSLAEARDAVFGTGIRQFGLSKR